MATKKGNDKPVEAAQVEETPAVEEVKEEVVEVPTTTISSDKLACDCVCAPPDFPCVVKYESTFRSIKYTQYLTALAKTPNGNLICYSEATGIMHLSVGDIERV